jgi:iron complex transport system permease protein
MADNESRMAAELASERTRFHRTLTCLALAVAVLAAVGLMLGPAGLGLPGKGVAPVLILTEVRLPRVLLAIGVGAALAIAGAALQAYLRNPLAEPGLIGVSGGAALGAVIAIHSGLSAAFALALPGGGLAGALAAMIVVVGLARRQTGALGLILAGIAVSSLTGALTLLALNLAPNPFASAEIAFWLLGSLTDRSLLHVAIAGPPMIAGGIILLAQARDLDVMALGEEAAGNLGVDPDRLRLRLIAGTSLAVGAATAITGAIAFVGLITPHLLRPLVGHTPSRLLPASALAGAGLLLAGDIAVRLAAPVADVRLGVVTSLIGAPFFLWLVVRASREHPA